MYRFATVCELVFGKNIMKRLKVSATNPNEFKDHYGECVVCDKLTKFYCFACKQPFCFELDRTKELQIAHEKKQDHAVRKRPVSVVKMKRFDKFGNEFTPFYARFSCYHYHHEEQMDQFWARQEDASVRSFQFPSLVAIATGDDMSDTSTLLSPSGSLMSQNLL